MAKVKKEDLTYEAPRDTKKAILGTLVGPCADIINPTRNGRQYDESLWEKVFNDDIVKEYFEAGGIFGELGHPADRTETDMEKIAICMPEPPTKGDNGLLMGRWDILDTPNGRILKTLIDYGYKIGISSRGSGDVYDDIDGKEHVDEDTYDFQAFDAVLLPAVKAARLSPVTESLDTKKTFNQALCESYNKATEDEKKIMKESLDNLGIKLEEDKKEEVCPDCGKTPCICKDKKECDNEDCLDTEDKSEVKDEALESVEAKDNGSEDLSALSETLKANKILEAQIADIQNKLAVSDTKVSKLEEELAKYKEATSRLSDLAAKSKNLTKEVSKLKEELEVKEQTIVSQTKRINSLRESVNKENILTESINAKDTELKQLKESVEREKNTLKESINVLEKQLADEKLNSQNKLNETEKKLTRSNKLVEYYKRTSNTIINKYIESKANMLGISANEIKNKLSESFNIDDIDKVCESLQSYKLNMSKLPFDLKNNSKIRITESKKDNLNRFANTADDIDDSLLDLAGLSK